MNIVVGVSGGIAAYKAVVLVRALVKDGHEVHVVPTEAALRFVGLPTWEAISRQPVTTSVHDDVASVRHVALGQRADLVIVAPATANTLARMAAGIADDLLGTTLLATRAPVYVAPAMHTEMWQHPATQDNVAQLVARGVIVLGPESGPLTGHDTGPGRMVEPEDILEALAPRLRPDSAAAGLRVVVSAGGTREPIDPVRFIGNRSSGRQGVACALAAADGGADVDLVVAHVDEGVLAPAWAHPRVRVRHVATAAELGETMRALSESAEVIVMAAAVSDYRVESVSEHKLTKESTPPGEGRTLTLIENADILRGLVTARRDGQTIVGFAAETPAEGETLRDRGVRKRRRKGVDLLAVNAVGWTTGFEASDNALLVIDDTDDVVAEVSGSKRAVADGLWTAILAHRSR